MKSKFNSLSIFEEKNIRKQVRSCFLIFKSRGLEGFRLNEILTPDEVQSPFFFEKFASRFVNKNDKH
jgi:hypothetical protein